MSEETDGTIAGAEGVDAPEAVDTKPEATPGQPEAAAEEAAPADDAGDEPSPKKVPWFQKRIDEVTASKYEAQREAAYWKGIAEGKTPAKEPELTTADLPRLEDFDWDEARHQAALTKAIMDRAEKTIDEKLSKREVELTEKQKNDTAIARLRDGGSKIPDFAAAVSGLGASDAIRDFLLEDDNASTILYELGKDDAATKRFNSLSPVQQAIELGKRAALATVPKATPAKPLAPPPPETVAGLVSGIGKTPDEMSMAEYIEWQKERDKT